MSRSHFAICISLLFLFFVFTETVQARSTSQVENKLVKVFEVRSADIHLALMNLAQQEHVRIGLELMPEEISRKPKLYFDLRMQNCRVIDILTEIVKNDPQYRWQVDDDVISVFPIIRVASVLNVVVPQISLENINRSQVGAKVANIEIVKQSAAALGVYQRTITSVPYSAGLKTFTISMKEATVREIFNETLRLAEAFYWVVQIYGSRDGGHDKYFMVQF